MTYLDFLREFLSQNKIALLFLTVGIGYLLSDIKVKGVGVGVASVLFFGLLVGAFGQGKFTLPDIVSQFGLVLFVYTIGLQAGPSFFRILKKRGIWLVLIAIAAIFSAATIAALSVKSFGVNPIIAVGLFCGALTNTPSLAAAAESLKGNPDVALLGIGYSVAYPLGVILPILIAQLFAHIKGVDLKSETKLAEKESGQLNEPPVAHDFNIKKEFAGKSIEETGLLKLNIRISRLQRAESQSIPMPDTILKENDLVHLVGTEQSIAKAIAILGAPVIHEVVPMRRDQVDFRRILLTNKKLVGRTLAEAHLESDFGAVVTRVRRGDVDFVPTNDTVLERGDRLRLVAPTEKFKLISDYLGDSTKALSQIDYLSLSLGILIGIVIGEIEIPIGGFNLKLGLAGGPLLVALILGWRGRTGKIIWDMPIEINMTFRELGLVLFFAAVGLKSGAVFMNAIAKEGASLIFFGALITLSLSLIIMLCAMYLLKLDWVTSTGMMAGGQTQPAVLTFIGKLSHSEAPNAAYVSIMPVAMILKIIVAQILLWILLNQ